jgi:hypothetical protein
VANLHRPRRYKCSNTKLPSPLELMARLSGKNAPADITPLTPPQSMPHNVWQPVQVLRINWANYSATCQHNAGGYTTFCDVLAGAGVIWEGRRHDSRDLCFVSRGFGHAGAAQASLRRGRAGPGTRNAERRRQPSRRAPNNQACRGRLKRGGDGAISQCPVSGRFRLFPARPL